MFDPATGEVQGVVTSVAEITYKGLKCFGRQGGIGNDQPYVIISVVQTDPYVDGDQMQGMAVDWVADQLAKLSGSGDDKLGDGSFLIPFSTWAEGTLPPRQSRDGIEYNYKQYRTDGDASYDVMYDIQLTHVVRPV